MNNARQGDEQERSAEGAEFRRLGAAFNQGGARYDRLRPGYPPDAVDWLLGSIRRGSRVADIGAGTGKFTSILLERGLDVTAIDPSPDMLAQLAQRLPLVQTIVGSGEDTGLADSSIEFATFAQAWHWVDSTAGVAELARVLVPGGVVGMLWNILDDRVDWVAELVAAWHTISGAESTGVDPDHLDLGDEFSQAESLDVAWNHCMPISDLADLITTRSYYLSASSIEQSAVRQQVAGVLANHFPMEGSVTVPYKTHCFRLQCAA